MRRIAANSSQIAQPMHNLDVGSDVPKVPPGTDSCGQLAGPKRCRPTMINSHAIRCYRGEFVPTDRGVGSRNHRPRVRVGGGFAGEVARVELRDGRVEVVEVERNGRQNPLVPVDLDDVEGTVLNCPGIAARTANTCEGEVLAA